MSILAEARNTEGEILNPPRPWRGEVLRVMVSLDDIRTLRRMAGQLQYASLAEEPDWHPSDVAALLVRRGLERIRDEERETARERASI